MGTTRAPAPSSSSPSSLSLSHSLSLSPSPSLVQSCLLLSLLLLILCCCPSVCHADRDLYAILGVGRDASDGDIKKAYRKLSLQYHPDKNPGDEEAHKKYMDIQYAHEILSDEDKRNTYDVDGEAGLKAEAQPRGGSIFDLFGGGGQQQGGKRKGADYKMSFSVTLEELYNGITKTIRISRNVLCRSCKGTGAKDAKTKSCPHCGGKGQVTSLQQIAPGFNVQMQQPCPHCGGKGKTASVACPVCGGKKVKMEEKELEVLIEKGMREGDEIRFERASEQAPDTVPGDVVLTLTQQSHSRYTRHGNGLSTTLTISLADALLGFSTTLPALDNEPRRIPVKETGVTQCDSVRKIVGEGMPVHEFPSEKGDLEITYKVQFPKKLTEAQKQAIKALLE